MKLKTFGSQSRNQNNTERSAQLFEKVDALARGDLGCQLQRLQERQRHSRSFLLAPAPKAAEPASAVALKLGVT